MSKIVDIERYLMPQHILKEYIPCAWFSHKVLSTIVQKSSGQFIYPATVKYISSDRHQPVRRLEIALGMHPPRNDLPFTKVDAMYFGSVFRHSFFY